jgi:hypothetical protein
VSERQQQQHHQQQQQQQQQQKQQRQHTWTIVKVDNIEDLVVRLHDRET